MEVDIEIKEFEMTNKMGIFSHEFNDVLFFAIISKADLKVEPAVSKL